MMTDTPVDVSEHRLRGRLESLPADVSYYLAGVGLASHAYLGYLLWSYLMR